MSVFNLSAGTFNWSATGMPSWVTVSPLSGTAAQNQPSSVTLTANPAALTAGISQAVLNVSASGATGSPQLVSVTFRVLPATAPAAGSLNPLGLVLLAAQGSTATVSQAVTLSNSGSGTLAFQLAASTVSGGSWLSVTPSSGSQPAGATAVQVRANPSGLAAGLYRGKVTATLSPGAPQDLDVLFAVTPGATASGLLSRAGPGAAVDCVPQSFDLVSTTLGNGQSLVVSFPRVILALVVDSCGVGVNTATVLATADGANVTMQPLANGLYTGNWVPQRAAASVSLTLTAIHPSFSNSVQRSYTVSTIAPDASQQLPVLSDDGVVEGAAFTPRRPLAPGGIVSLFGVRLAGSTAAASRVPLDRELAGVSVQMGGLNAPLYFVSPGQINAQVPFELTPGSSVPILVTSGGRLTAPQNYFIAPAEPGVFIAGSVPAILDGRSRLITTQNPALVGDTLQIFATGLGLTDVSAATGAAAPSFSTVRLPVTVTIGGVPASVVYQGLAPGFVGLYQVNVVVPASVTPGSAVPVALTQNGVPSNPGTPITIPVQKP